MERDPTDVRPEAPGAESLPASMLVYDGFAPHVERGVEAAFSVSNGLFGVRASLEEGNPASHPMVIVAGVYVPTVLAASQTLLATDDPASVVIAIDGERIQLAGAETLAHRRTLDVRHGEVARSWLFRDRENRQWRLESLRAASAADERCYLHRLLLAPEGDAAGTVSLRFAAPPVLEHAEDRAASRTVLVTSADVPPLGTIRTSRRPAGDWRLEGDTVTAPVTRAAPLHIESVSHVGGGPGVGVVEATFDQMLASHRRVRSQRWDDADIIIEGNDELQRAIRFALHHLLSAAPPHDGYTSIGARDLSGEAYHGHIFWDTEIFMLPALIFSHPEAARSCLLYRYRTLDAARARAHSLGFAGALYAWESTDTGEDRTPSSVILPDGSAQRIFTGEQEHHISSAVPYAVVQYWRATGDDRFMLEYGAEMVFECARFWNSRVTVTDDQYSIGKVIGPDEFHVGVDDDAYTNAMAAWTLRTASELAGRLSTIDESSALALRQRLRIEPAEPAEWAATASRISRSSFFEPRVVEQFDGFFGLRSVDVSAYRKGGVPLDIALGFAAVQGVRAVKQADVLMTAALLPDVWQEDAFRANFAFYEPLTAHTSSLSPPVHALLSAWLRDAERCRSYLDETARIDLGDFRGAAGGVHLAAQGGLWQAVIFGLAGFKFTPDAVAFDPFLPPGLPALSFALQWRGRRIRVRIAAEGMLEIDVDGPVTMVRVNGMQRPVEGRAVFAFDPTITFWSAMQQGGTDGA